MFGTTLVARVPRFWQLSLVPRPLDLSSYIFNTRVLGTRWWIIQQPSSLGWRQCETTHVNRSPKFCTLQPLLVHQEFSFFSLMQPMLPTAPNSALCKTPTEACRRKS